MTAFTSGAVPLSCFIVPAPKRLCSILWPARRSDTGEGTKSASGTEGLGAGFGVMCSFLPPETPSEENLPEENRPEETPPEETRPEETRPEEIPPEENRPPKPETPEDIPPPSPPSSSSSLEIGFRMY